jgi:DNA-binding MarR family transcriptional regulator
MAGSAERRTSTAAATAVEHDSRELFALTIRVLETIDVDMPVSGLRALLALDDIDTCTLGELAEQLALSQSATSRMVDKLVVGGLVDRRAGDKDRRRVTLRATSVGRRAIGRIVRRRRNAIADIMVSMSPSEREQLRVGLRGFADVVRHPPASG